MHATMRHHGAAGPGRPIRGTFYPGDGPHGGAGIAAALPKILAVMVAVAVVRHVARAAGHGHGASSRGSRRREAIAQFHRELHAADAPQEGAPVKA